MKGEHFGKIPDVIVTPNYEGQSHTIYEFPYSSLYSLQCSLFSMIATNFEATMLVCGLSTICVIYLTILFFIVSELHPSNVRESCLKYPMYQIIIINVVQMFRIGTMIYSLFYNKQFIESRISEAKV